MGLDTVELIMAVETNFGIDMPNEVAAKMRTPGDIYEYVLTDLEKQRNARVPDLAREIVWQQLVGVIVAQLGVERGKVTKMVKIVDELGADWQLFLMLWFK